jgi:hypothetical protein
MPTYQYANPETMAAADSDASTALRPGQDAGADHKLRFSQMKPALPSEDSKTLAVSVFSLSAFPKR